MTNNYIPETMRVPRFLGKGKIDFIEKPVLKPGPGQLLLRCKANALCASGLGAFHNGTNVTPGHEATGIVVAAGDDTRIPIGTPGVVFLMDFCGKCRSCKLGFTNQCFAKRADYGFNRDGGYGVYALINENVFFPIDPDIPLTEATLLLDIMGTGRHSIKRGRLVHPDVQSVLITGAGPIGLGVLAMTKISIGKETPVMISDFIPYRLELAERLGGLPINLNETSLHEGIQQYGFEMVDMAIDASGKSVARRSAMNLLAKRGVLVCVGHGEGLQLNVSGDLIGSERAVLGSEYFCYNELAENLEFLRSNLSYLSQIITHRFPVADIQRAFELFIERNSGKVVIEQ